MARRIQFILICISICHVSFPQPTTNPPPQTPPNQVPNSSPSLSFFEREKCGIPKIKIRQEWALVTKEEGITITGIKLQVGQENPIHINLHQYLPCKFSPAELPDLQPPTRGFSRGKFQGDNFSPVMAFIFIKSLSLATKLRSLLHQPLGK